MDVHPRILASSDTRSIQCAAHVDQNEMPNGIIFHAAPVKSAGLEMGQCKNGLAGAPGASRCHSSIDIGIDLNTPGQALVQF